MNNINMKSGKLTIFTSYTPGAGKSYFMVERAVKKSVQGEKVHFAFLNDAHRNINGITEEIILKEKIANKYSVKDILADKPDLVVIDEMGMHGINVDEDTFVYQDVEKMLDAGIDVYTTTNLKRFKTANPLFKSVTGIGIKKTIPDRFLEMAETIYFIDREPKLMAEDFIEKNLFCEKHRNSKIMRKNFKLDTLKSYRDICFKFLDKYKSKVKIVTRH